MVLFKLDGGLDHILVDEAQDTSPLQWNVVKALAQEFFSGHGQTEAVRTIFAVGDEKQSSMVSRVPHRTCFARCRPTSRIRRYRSVRAGRRWHWACRSALLHRCSKPWIACSPMAPAPVASAARWSRTLPFRAGHAGRVEIWPLEESDDEGDTSLPWEPLSAPVSARPAARLAARIADTIKGWLDRGEKLASENRAIRPGDILILVRKRAPFAPQMVSALKARRIPVAGADRLPLTEQIAVMDLMALGQVMLLRRMIWRWPRS